MFQNKKYLPLYYFISLLLFPVIFGYLLDIFFQLGSIERIYKFEKLIFSNIKSFANFKKEIYLSFLFGLMPLITLFVLSMPKNRSTTHGKAKWATRSDIETYVFSFGKFFKDLIALINPINIFKPKKWFKNLFEFCKIGMIKKNKIDVNFGNGFILGLWEDLTSKKKVCYDQPLSSLIIAPPGAGKSTAVAIPNLLSLKTSCIVLDIKGELCELTAGYRQKALKNKILIFDPMGKGNTLKFNPFAKKIVSKMDFNAKRRLVDEIAQTIFVDEKGSDPHWINQARNLFIFYALYDLCVYGESSLFRIARAPMRDYRPFIYPDSPYYEKLWQHDEKSGKLILKNGSPIQNQGAEPEKLYFQQVSEQIYLDPRDPRNFSQKARDENPDLDEDKPDELKDPKNRRLDEIIRDYARAWSSGSGGNEFNSIKSTYNRVMQHFTSYQIKSCVDGMSFEYEDFRRENITLYIRIAQTDIETLAPLIRILLESIAKNLLLKESKKPEERIYFVLDEFVRFGKLEFLLEMPALSRSYGIVVLFITQSNALIEKYYSDKDAKILGSTVAYKIVFKTDQEYAKQLSEEIGKYTRRTQSQSTKENALIFGGSSTFSKEGVNLVTEQDILNLDKDDILILVKGYQATPIKLKANYWFKDKSMKSKINWELKTQEIENEKISPILNKTPPIPLPPKEKTIEDSEQQLTEEDNEEELIDENNTSNTNNAQNTSNTQNQPILDEPLSEEQQRILQIEQEAYIQKQEKIKQLKIEWEYSRILETTNDRDIYPPSTTETHTEKREDTKMNPEKPIKKEYVVEITDREILVKLMPPNSVKNITPQVASKLESDPDIQSGRAKGLKVKFESKE